MKKVIAIVLALVMALSCTAIAFAATVYTCPICSKSFTSYDEAVKDVYSCYNKAIEALDKDGTAFTCPICSKSFTSYGEAVKDVSSCLSKAIEALDKDGTAFTCPFCSKAFTSSYDTAKAHIISCYLKTIETTTKLEWSNECPYCHNIFTDESTYDDHIDICYSQNGGVANRHDNFFNLTANQILDMLHDFFSRDTDLWGTVSDIIIRIIDLFENLGTAATTEADVAGAVDELEAKVASLPIVGDALEYVHNLINSLKQKIKDIYAHDVETVAEEPVSTGSTSVGIAAFAAVSVAAAAAYVCTKKKEN